MGDLRPTTVNGRQCAEMTIDWRSTPKDIVRTAFARLPQRRGGLTLVPASEVERLLKEGA